MSRKASAITALITAAVMTAAILFIPLAPTVLALSDSGYTPQYELWDCIVSDDSGRITWSDFKLKAISDRSGNLMFDTVAIDAVLSRTALPVEYEPKFATLPVTESITINQEYAKILIMPKDTIDTALVQFLLKARFRHDIAYYDIRRGVYHELPTALETIDEQYLLVRYVPIDTLAEFTDTVILFDELPADEVLNIGGSFWAKEEVCLHALSGILE